MRVAVYGRYFKPRNKIYVQEVFDRLAEYNLTPVVHKNYYDQFGGEIQLAETPEFFNGHIDIKDSIDCMLSLGGDGTILDTVTLVRDSGIPILGINLGRLGFLAHTSKEDVGMALRSLKERTYQIDRRTLIHLDSNKPLFEGANYALNEFSIHKKDSSAMITIHTYINGELLNSYWADGLIIATPTGSTGYSLSCGGPIIFPNSENFVITPIAPHNLNVRPIIVDDSAVLSFEIEGRSDNFLVTLDSRYETADLDFQLAVKRERFHLNLLRINDMNFLNTLRDKLMWGADQRNY